MNARRDSSDEPTRGSSGGKALLIAAVVLALGATGLLVVTEELKLLRLGIVAALWAALVGAFLAARYRRQVADQEEAAAERQERYELELEREVAARREYELEVAAEARRRAQEESNDDIAALRQELYGLRQTLESLLGGEFLVERYALRAEASRMRPLPDDRSLRRLPPAKVEQTVVPEVVQEAQTDLIERVQETRQQQPAKRKVEPLPRRADRPARTEFPRPEPIRPMRVEHPAEASDRWFVPDGLGTDAEPKPTASQPYAARPPATDEPTMTRNRHMIASGYMEPVGRPRSPGSIAASAFSAKGAGNQPQPGRADPNGSGYQPPVGRADPNGSGYQPQPGRADPNGSGYLSRPASPGSGPPPQVARPNANGAGHHLPNDSGYLPPVARPNATGAVPQPPTNSGYLPPVGHPNPNGSGYGPPAAPPFGRPDASGYGNPASGYGAPVNQPQGGRRRREEPDTGGRRRRAEGQPTWQEARRNAAPEPEPSGSHASGRSVSELLASHGGANSQNTPRRRRRRED